MMHGEESSTSNVPRVSLNRTSSMPNCTARSCSLQVPLFLQVVQSLQWFASSSSMIFRRYLRSRAVFVLIFMPGLGIVEQDAIRRPFSSSTIHIRQAP